MADLKNAAPNVYLQGINDRSTVPLPPAELGLPQHLPKFYLFAEQGPAGDYIVNLGEETLEGLYGSETFRVGSKLHTHCSEFARTAAGAGNNMVIHRVVDPREYNANVTLFLDLIKTKVPLYQRDTEGNIVLDESGLPKKELDDNDEPKTTEGVRASWVLGYIGEEELKKHGGKYRPGLQASKDGFLSEGSDTSIMYPLFEFWYKDVGPGGSRLGLNLFPMLKTGPGDFPEYLMEDAGLYPFQFGLVRREGDDLSNPREIFSDLGSRYVRFSLGEDAINPLTDDVVDIIDIINDNYVDVSPITASGLGGVHVYRENLNSISEELFELEKAAYDANPIGDAVFNTDKASGSSINLLTFTHSTGAPYQALILEDSPSSDAVRLTSGTNIYLGDVPEMDYSYERLENAMLNDLAGYTDPLNSLSENLIGHPESIIYDSGFSLKTKLAIPKFIARRKDTFAVIGSTIHGANLSIEEQYSIAVAVESAFQLYPESVVYNTPTVRGIIMMGSGEIIGSRYRDRVPTTYWLLEKSADFMGGEDGKWKPEFLFDKADTDESTVIKNLKNLDITWVPGTTRTKFWSSGLNFPLDYKNRHQFFPALRTVYKHETSILTSYFNAIGCAFLNKIAYRVWQQFTGDVELTPSQLEERVNERFAEYANGCFAGILRVVPNAKVTEFDEQRGWSWTMNVRVYGNNMKTVMVTSIETYRFKDLQN